jgi:DNA repair exonuclease SbcCD ATPase subunit
MSKNIMKVFASLADLNDKTIDKMTKAELKDLLKKVLSELDNTVQRVTSQAPNIDERHGLMVTTSLALAPLICLVDKYIQVIFPEMAKAYRHNAMEYLNKLSQAGLIKMHEPEDVNCNSCGQMIMMYDGDDDDVSLCTACLKRVKTPEEDNPQNERVRQ